MDLANCPFCGEKPQMTRIGNKYTRRRAIEIKCPNCRAQRTDATIRFGFEWLEKVAVEKWNNRPNADPKSNLAKKDS